MERFCECNTEYQKKVFFDYGLSWCDKCHKCNIEKIECEHEYKPVLFEISNGSFQLRLTCMKCYHIDSKSQKQSDHKGPFIKKNLEKYNQWVYDQRKPMNLFIEELSLKRGDVRAVYSKYIVSPEWYKIREKAMIRDNYTCQICGGMAQEVHHLTYFHLIKEYLFELVSLCKKCHDLYPNSFKNVQS